MANDARTAEHVDASADEVLQTAELNDEVSVELDRALDFDAYRDSSEGVERHGQRSPLRVALVVVLAVLVVLVGVGAWMGHQIVEDRRAEEHRQMLVGVGRQAAVNLTTIDHTTVHADIKRILDSTTGTFHDDFQKRADPFVQAVTEAQSKSVGDVTEVALESQDGDDAQVLVAVAVKTSAAGVEEPQPRAWRMRVTVSQPSGQDPMVSNVQFVP